MGVRGIVAASKAYYCKRTLGLCLERRVGLITLVPRTCVVRQEVETWGQQHGPFPLVLEKPGRTRQEPPRYWHGNSVIRSVAVEDADGRQDVVALRFLVVHSSQLASQGAAAYAAAQAKEAAQVAEHIQRVEARWFACVADAEAAMVEYEGRGQGRRGRMPQPWRYPALRYRVEAVTQRQKRMQRGRPPKPHCPRTPSAITSGSRQQPTCRLPTRRAGQSWRPPWGQRAVQILRYSMPIKSNISQWNQGFAGSRIPPLSAPCGWRNPNGLRPWPCSLSRSCWSLR